MIVAILDNHDAYWRLFHPVVGDGEYRKSSVCPERMALVAGDIEWWIVPWAPPGWLFLINGDRIEGARYS